MFITVSLSLPYNFSYYWQYIRRIKKLDSNWAALFMVVGSDREIQSWFCYH